MPESPAAEPRRRPVLLWFVGGVFGSAILGCVLLWFALFGPRGNGIPIGPETTIYDGPLDEHGYVDYAAIVNNEPSVPPEDNAAGCYVTVLMDRVRERYEPVEFQKLCNKLGIEPLADEDNPWLMIDIHDKRWLSRANIKADLPSSDESDEIYDKVKSSPWTRAEHPLLSDWLDANERAFEKFTEGTYRPKYDSGVHNIGFAGLHRPSDEIWGIRRDLSRCLTIHAMRAVGEQDWAAATRDIDALHRMSWHHFKPPTYIDVVVSVVIQLYACRVEQQLIARSPSTEFVKARRKVIASQPLFDDLADALDRRERFDNLGILQLIDRTARELTTDGYMLTDFESNIWLPERYRDLYLIRRIDTAEASRRSNDQFDRAVAALKQPPDTRGQAWQAFLETLPDAPKWPLGDNAFVSADVLIDRLINNKSYLQNTYLTQARRNTRQTLLDVFCAARLFELEHGRFATSPDDLIPKYLDAWPVDDFDRTPLEHRIVDDAWVIYSRLGDPEEPEDFESIPYIKIGP